MHINPIYKKELKLSTRSFKFPILFMIYIIAMAAWACLLCSIIFQPYSYTYSSNGPYEAVIYIFILLAITLVVVILLETPAFTSDAIAGERERQTLDILLTTSLKPSQIIIGKLFSSLSTLFLLAFLGLPVLSITSAIGGIHIKDLLQLFLFIVICLFTIGSMGICFSTLAKRTAIATIMSYAGILIMTIGTAVVVIITAVAMQLHNEQIGQQTGQYPELNLGPIPFILLINPAVTMAHMLIRNYASLSVVDEIAETVGFDQYGFALDHWFALSACTQILLGVLFLYLATKHLNPLHAPKQTHKTRKKKV